jgi:hypothetical protein
MEEVKGRDLSANTSGWSICKLFAVPTLTPVIELGEKVNFLHVWKKNFLVALEQLKQR